MDVYGDDGMGGCLVLFWLCLVNVLLIFWGLFSEFYYILGYFLLLFGVVDWC